MTKNTTRLLLADGWHDVTALTWPPFRGQPGYAGLLTDRRRWLIGPATALLAVDTDDEILADVLGQLAAEGPLDPTELGRLINDAAAHRAEESHSE